MPSVAQELLTSANYSLLSYSGLTNTGNSVFGGVVGSYPTQSYTGFNPPAVATIDSAHAQQARIDGNSAFLYYQGLSSTQTLTSNSDMGAQQGGGSGVNGTYRAGVYVAATGLLISTAITLDAQGNSSALFVFQAGSTVTQAIAGTITLVNGAQPNNVIWVVGSSWTSTTGPCVTVGNILAYASVTLGGGTFNGRALAVGGGNGAVTVSSATLVTLPIASAPAGFQNITVNVGIPNGLIQVQGSPAIIFNSAAPNIFWGQADPSGTVNFVVANGTYILTASDPLGVYVFRNRLVIAVNNNDTSANMFPTLKNASNAQPQVGGL
jgi:Ice-binding-like